MGVGSMWIKDLEDGTVRKYGTNCHDSLRISNDGRSLTYYNLQNGDGSMCGAYRFVTDEEGLTPDEDDVCIRHGADAYFNIGGFEERKPKTKKKCKGCMLLHTDACDMLDADPSDDACERFINMLLGKGESE